VRLFLWLASRSFLRFAHNLHYFIIIYVYETPPLYSELNLDKILINSLNIRFN